jgi:hypothetical protein
METPHIIVYESKHLLTVSFTRAKGYETEPTVHTHPKGPLFIPVPISIAQYLESRYSEDAMEGPLTDNELSMSDGEADVPSADSNSQGTFGENQPQPGRPMTRSEKRKERVKKNRNKRRQATQEADGTDLKAVVIKRRQEAVKDAIQTGYSLQNKASATAAGWTGMVPRGLAAKKSRRPFSWDGR